MTWFKVDDTLAFNAKAVAAGNAAMGLWVRAGAWAAQQLTDGHVPAHIAATLGSRAEIRRLVDVGLWLEQDGGYGFWQWSERQPSRSQVEADRNAARERQRAARERAKSQRESRRDTPVSHADVTPLVTVPPTRPDPTISNTEGPRKRGSRIPDHWAPSVADVEWQRAEGISDDMARRELPKFRDYWVAKPGRDGVKLDWSATWRNWLRSTAERQAKPAVRAVVPEW